MRGIGSGRRVTGAPERRSTSPLEVRCVCRRREVKMCLNMLCILRRIFLGSKCLGRKLAIRSDP
jgi:hypothetical protein